MRPEQSFFLKISLPSGLDKANRLVVLLINLVLIGLISVIEYLTTYEISFSVFYLLPISVIAWNNGQRYGYWVSALTVCLWFLIDARDHDFSHPYIPYLNLCLRFSVFCYVVFLLDSLRSSRDELEMRIRERTRKLTRTTALLESEMKTRKELERNILEVSEEEQARIARELHDSLGQLLTGLAFLAESLSTRLADIDQEASKQAGEIIKVAQDAIKQTRYISHGLVPFNIKNQGVRNELEQLAKEVSEHSGIPCETHFNDVLEISDTMIATHIYRIAQEALNNAVKHSSATRLFIELLVDESEIRLTVADNGTGIDGDQQEVNNGIGMMNMKYRAQIIGATISLESQPGKGTSIILVLPFEQGVRQPG